MFSVRFLFPVLYLQPCLSHPTLSVLVLLGMIDSLEVCGLMQRSGFGSIPAGNGVGLGHVDGDG